MLFYHFTIDDNIHVDAHYMYIKNEYIKTLVLTTGSLIGIE